MSSDSTSKLARTAWLVVVLLLPVALLNYLDRQMLAAMKFSVMSDIPSIGSEANWGRMLGQFKWVYAFLSPDGTRHRLRHHEPREHQLWRIGGLGLRSDGDAHMP